MVKNLPAEAGDTEDKGSIPGLGRSPGEGHGNPLQYSCLEILHGQRNVAGYSPWSHKESDMTEPSVSGLYIHGLASWIQTTSDYVVL